MFPSRFLCLPIVVCAVVLAAPSPRASLRPVPQARPLLVSAASSLATAMPEIERAFERETGMTVDLNLAASSSLARQIIEGAPVDVFVSADVAQMDRVENQAGLLPGSRVDLLSNQLVVAVHTSGRVSIGALGDLAGPAVRMIGVADPAAVPAGVYWRAHLEEVGLWARVESKLIPMQNVRSVLGVLESGNVDAGLIYRTDAAIVEDIRVAVAIPIDAGPAIVYPVAIPTGAPSRDAARRFLAFLRGRYAERVFERLGFIGFGSPGQDGARGGSEGDSQGWES